MVQKLLILYKTIKIKNSFGKIFDLTYSYCNKFNNIDSYFLVCDEHIKEPILLKKRILYIKAKEDNYESLLVKVIIGLNYFKNRGYTHFYISNISSFINIPLLYQSLTEHKIKIVVNRFYNNGPLAFHKFNNINYIYPSGSGILFNKSFTNELCDFFEKNNYINKNRLTENFRKNYPNTDDIFFGYYIIKKKITSGSEIKRYDILKNNEIIPKEFIYSHYRIKTGNFDIDYKYHKKLFKIIYKN